MPVHVYMCVCVHLPTLLPLKHKCFNYHNYRIDKA